MDALCRAEWLRAGVVVRVCCRGQCRAQNAVVELLTIGHGTLPQNAFTALVAGAEVEEVVDVRSFPGSRHNPQFGRAELERWLPEAGLAYTWLPSLGGRRPLGAQSAHTALRHPAFRAYADHMQTDEFATGVGDLLSRGGQTAVMCSESVWWRCHRRLLADYLLLVRGFGVGHLMHDRRIVPHRPTPGVRLAGHTLIYDQDAVGQ